MSTTTEVLNLFKYDTETDKKEKFNINQSLNNNWDKIDNFAKEVGKGSGLKIGDIGFAPYVDETTNERRRLNGQVLIKDQYPAFVTWLTGLQATTPSLFTTEDNWQAIKTASKLGQCGKFVIGDTTIRLPQVININGLVDMSNAGLIKDESLPAHMHSRGTQNITGNILAGHGASGAFTYVREQNCRVDYNGANVNDMYEYSFMASRTWTGKTSNPDNSTYKDNAPVQQEAIQYPYYITVNTGSETENNIVNKLELNNPFSFGVSQYYKGEMNNLSWLRSNGQKNYKAVYSDFYNWALTQLNAGVEGFKNHTDDDITDYDLVINQSDESFILPLKNGMETIIDYSQGTDISSYTSSDNQFKAPSRGFIFLTGNGEEYGFLNGLRFATRQVGSSNQYFNNQTILLNKGDTYYGNYEGAGVAGYSNKFFPFKGNGNLYYFVGETMQNSNLANLGRIEETLVNKVDYTQAARASMPSKKYDDLTLLASGQTYIAPADGWVSLSIRSASASTATVNLISNGNGFQTNSYGSSGVECRGFIPVTKGNHFEIYYANVQATPETFRFVYAEGVANT